MRYNVGDRVRIVDSWVDGCRENNQGHMDQWLGQVMTIRAVDEECYTMVEDEGEWAWFEPAVAGLAKFHNADLRSGDVVQCRNGLQYMVMLNCGTYGKDILLNVQEPGYNLLISYGADMKYDGEDADWDIMKVRRVKNYAKEFVPEKWRKLSAS